MAGRSCLYRGVEGAALLEASGRSLVDQMRKPDFHDAPSDRGAAARDLEVSAWQAPHGAPPPAGHRRLTASERGEGRLMRARWGQRWSFELTPDGPDATVVTEIFDCSQVPENQRADIDHGSIRVESMRQTLERLDQLCTSQPGAAAQG